MRENKGQQEENLIHVEHLSIQKKRVLGRGGFGKVYYGTYYKSPVAIKALKSAHLTKKGIEHFKREVKLLLYVIHEISLKFTDL